MNRTHDKTITIDLCPEGSCSMFMGFIFCVVIGKTPSSSDHKIFIGCDCYFEIGDGERVNLGHNMDAWSSIYACEFESDHVCMWFDERCCLQTKESVSESMAGGDSQRISFEFFAQTGTAFDKKNDILIRECGVCPVYASEYQKFMEQMEMELESQKCKAIEDECSGKNETENSKNCIFSRFPCGRWKMGTQGLKDIVNL